VTRFREHIRQTIALATPIALGSTSQILIGLIDSAMVGHLGTVPLAASALGNSVFGFFYVVGIGLLMPLSVMVSETHGAGKYEGSLPWLRSSIALALLFSLLSFLLIVLLDHYRSILGAPTEVLEEARTFMLLMAVSLLPSMLWQCLKQYAESLGHAWLPMGVMAACVVINTLLNWLLIYGNWGFPALGLTGSGISTLIARSMAVFLLLAFMRHKLPAWAKPDLLPCFEAKRMRELLQLGVPSAGQLFFEVGAFSAGALIMGWLGATALAAHQIALSCASATFMFPLGIGLATSMLLAKATGAGEPERLRSISLSGLVAAWACMGLASLFLLLLPTQIALLFTSEPEVVSLAARLLMVAAFFQLLDGTQVVAACSLRGLRDVRIPTLITGIAYWGIAIPLSYLLSAHLLGPAGVWWGFAAGLGFCAVFLTRRLLQATCGSKTML